MFHFFRSFFAKEPCISGSFVKNDVQLKASYGSSPPCTEGHDLVEEVQHIANPLQHTATPCNTLQHTATHCNTLQHKRTRRMIYWRKEDALQHNDFYCKTIHSTATHCNALQRIKFCRNTRLMEEVHHIANTPQHTVTHCSAMDSAATQLILLQHTTTHCNTLHSAATHASWRRCTILQTHRNTPQHTAAHRNTLQHTAIHHIPDNDTLQHIEFRCNTRLVEEVHHIAKHTATHCNAPQHTATQTTTHCNTKYTAATQ